MCGKCLTQALIKLNYRIKIKIDKVNIKLINLFRIIANDR